MPISNTFFFYFNCGYIVLYPIFYIIAYFHDFLPPPRRGSHVKSGNTQTVIKIHPLAHILDTGALIFSSCDLFRVYPNLTVIPTVVLDEILYCDNNLFVRLSNTLARKLPCIPDQTGTTASVWRENTCKLYKFLHTKHTLNLKKICFSA